MNGEWLAEELQSRARTSARRRFSYRLTTLSALSDDSRAGQR